jgi:hypothetical protein
MTLLLSALLAAGAATAPSAPPAAVPTPPLALAHSPAVAKPTRTQVLAAVRSEWPRYDASATGRLTPLEFSTWVMRSHGGIVAPRAKASGIAPVSAMNASATAFSRADANHDGGVTPDEMTNFLMQPPTPTASTRAKAGLAKPAITADKTMAVAVPPSTIRTPR